MSGHPGSVGGRCHTHLLPNPQLNDLSSSLIRPLSSSHRWGLNVSGSGKIAGSRPMDLDGYNRVDQESAWLSRYIYAPNISDDACALWYTIIFLNEDDTLKNVTP